jgi:surface antigen
MQQILRVLPLLGVLSLAGCMSGGPSTQYAQGPTLATTPTPTMMPTTQVPTPAQQVASAQQLTDVSAFVDSSVAAKLTSNDRAQAAGAQFNALQFGRPGAPRAWQGDKGTSGNVMVGPYVRVNNIDCRDFTHSVKFGGQDAVKKGTACREVDGRWSVVNAS